MEEPFGLQDYADAGPVFSKDPVCGRKVDEAKAAGKCGYAGQMYYFCSPDCLRAFEQEPRRYAGSEPGSAAG